MEIPPEFLARVHRRYPKVKIPQIPMNAWENGDKLVVCRNGTYRGLFTGGGFWAASTAELTLFPRLDLITSKLAWMCQHSRKHMSDYRPGAMINLELVHGELRFNFFRGQMPPRWITYVKN